MADKIFHLEKCKNSNYTLFKIFNKKKKYLHSKYNPLSEAENILKELNRSKYDFIVLLGNGLGYVHSLLNQDTNIKKIIAIEKENEIFQLFSSLNKNNNFHKTEFLINKDPDDIIEHIAQQFNLINYKGIRVIEIPSIFNESRKYFEKIKSNLKKVLDNVINNQLTESALGIQLINNFINNLKQVKNINLTTINNAKSLDKTLIIAAAGTSLKYDIQHLQKLKNKAYIFAVDTALKYLIKNSITPDAAFCIDPQYFSFYHFYPEKPDKKIHYIMDIFSNFSCLKINPEFSFIISQNFISQQLFDRNNLITFPGGSITNYIYHMFKDQFKYIYITGLDYCFIENNMYIPYSYLNKFFLERNSKKSTIQTQYFKFYINRAKTKIKFHEKEYYTTTSMINYYQSLNEILNKANTFFSSNSPIELEGIKKRDFASIKILKPKDNIFIQKKISPEAIILKFKNLIKNDVFIRQLTNMVIFSKHLHSWKDFDDNLKKEVFIETRNLLRKKIEKL